MNNEATTKRELTLVTWKQVRADVAKVNSELAKIIDAISPNDDYKLVMAKYFYGDIFVKNGQTLLPSNNELVLISHDTIDKKIQKELLYSSIPLFLSLNKSNELFFDTHKRVIPINISHKGDLRGTYETMDYLMGRKLKTIWNYSSGIRSIFMLPKITDKTSLKKLQTAYNIPTTTQVNHLTDHWEIFKDIAQSKELVNPWQNTILFFGQTWFDNKFDSKEWQSFKNYLLRVIWEHGNYSINKIKFDVCWETFASILSSRRLQPKPYLIDQVKHLLSIVDGNFPAFAVASDPEEAAPIPQLQRAFTDHYSLKQYLPTIMHAYMPTYMPKNCPPKLRYIYYSLSIPTVLEGSPLKKNTTTIVNDLREIKLLIETLKNRFKTSYPPDTFKIIQNTNIDYFHYKNDASHQIRASDNIPLEDNSFLQDKNNFSSREFCATSPFFSGCIRIEVPHN